MIYGVKIMKIRAIDNLTKANFLRKRINDLSHTRRTFACCCPEEGGTSLGTKETAISFRLRLRPLYTEEEALNVLTNEERGGLEGVSIDRFRFKLHIHSEGFIKIFSGPIF
jgi:hypothetical protein